MSLPFPHMARRNSAQGCNLLLGSACSCPVPLNNRKFYSDIFQQNMKRALGADQKKGSDGVKRCFNMPLMQGICSILLFFIAKASSVPQGARGHSSCYRLS